MGFSEEDNLKLKPVNADRGWVGILRNWKGTLKPRLKAPVGVHDWEAQSAAETFTDLLNQEAGEVTRMTGNSGWLPALAGTCWKRAAWSRTSRRNGSRKPRLSTQTSSSTRGRASEHAGHGSRPWLNADASIMSLWPRRGGTQVITRAQNSLQRAGIYTIGALTELDCCRADGLP